MKELVNLTQFLRQEKSAIDEAVDLFQTLNQEVANQDRLGLLLPGEFDDDHRFVVWHLADKEAGTPPVDEKDADTLTADDIDKMSLYKLRQIVTAKDLVINPTYYDKDDIDDVREVIKEELDLKPEEEEDCFDYHVGLYLWLPPGCPDPVASTYVLIEGKTRRQRWYEVKRLQQALNGRDYLDHPNWEENQLEGIQYPLTAGLDVTAIAAEVVRVANQIAELNKAS